MSGMRYEYDAFEGWMEKHFGKSWKLAVDDHHIKIMRMSWNAATERLYEMNITWRSGHMDDNGYCPHFYEIIKDQISGGSDER